MVLDVWCVGDSEESPETDGVTTGSVAPLAAVSAAAAAALSASVQVGRSDGSFVPETSHLISLKFY